MNKDRGSDQQRYMERKRQGETMALKRVRGERLEYIYNKEYLRMIRFYLLD
jgi:hypothetical protein